MPYYKVKWEEFTVFGNSINRVPIQLTPVISEDEVKYIHSWCKKRKHQLTEQGNYIVTDYTKNIQVNYYVEFVEDKVYLTIRPRTKGRSDIQPGKDFLVQRKLVYSWDEFFATIFANMLDVEDYAEEIKD